MRVDPDAMRVTFHALDALAEDGLTIPVALIGCGAWGRNILRVLGSARNSALVAVADVDADRRDAAHQAWPRAKATASIEGALDAGARAIVIATPPHTHAKLALRAIRAGADVLVEKPLATTVRDAERCADAASRLGSVAMVGHLLRYHPAVEQLIVLVKEGILGALVRFDTRRVSVAGQRSASAVWTLGPHDLSVLQAIDPSPVRYLSAQASPGGDPTLIETTLCSGARAVLLLSRTGAVKERRITVLGQNGSAVLDDVGAPDCILTRTSAGQREIRVPWREPLAVEIEHFLFCVEHRTPPRTPLGDGVRIVRTLARMHDESIRASGIGVGITSGRS
jgi:predicted dehydrogenase